MSPDRCQGLCYCERRRHPNEDVAWVNKGEITGTFLYPTPGEEGVRQALKIVKGETVEKKIVLPTQTIDASNAAQILKENELL